MPYNFVAYSFHTKKLCSRLSSSEVWFWTEIGCFCIFEPPLGDLGATYDDHLRLVGKRTGDFLLVLIELFFARSFGWGATSDYWFKIGDFAPMGAGWPKFHVEGVAPHQSYISGRQHHTMTSRATHPCQCSAQWKALHSASSDHCQISTAGGREFSVALPQIGNDLPNNDVFVESLTSLYWPLTAVINRHFSWTSFSDHYMFGLCCRMLVDF